MENSTNQTTAGYQLGSYAMSVNSQTMDANESCKCRATKRIIVQWEPFETTITRQSLLWLGHLARMKKTRLPKQAFFGFWAGHKTRQWYQLAQNRDAWKAAVLNQFPLLQAASRPLL